MSIGTPLRRSGRCGVVALLLTAALPCASAAPEGDPRPLPPQRAAATAERGIPFLDLDAAIAAGRSAQRVIVVYFTAEWCGYCKKMEQTTFAAPAVEAMAKRFLWAKVDVDRQPGVAATFGVRVMPSFAFLNAAGELLDLGGGYQSEAAMLKLLEENADKAMAPGRERQRASEVDAAIERLKRAGAARETGSAVSGLVALLAAPERQWRAPVRKALLDGGPRTWEGLVTCLSDQRLAVRAAAHDVLSEATKQQFPYDAFAPRPERPAQVEPWKAWVAENAAAMLEAERLRAERRAAAGEAEAPNADER